MKEAMFGLALLATLGLTACGPTSDAVPPSHTAAPVSVQVTPVARGDMIRSISLSASVGAFATARLYAKVAGYLDKILVDIGDRVTKGQVLAVLAVPEMAMEYTQAEAEQAEVKAQLVKAQTDYTLQKVVLERSKTLRAREAITQQQLDEATARCEVAAAEVTLARSRIDNAQARLGKLK